MGVQFLRCGLLCRVEDSIPMYETPTARILLMNELLLSFVVFALAPRIFPVNLLAGGSFRLWQKTASFSRGDSECVHNINYYRSNDSYDLLDHVADRVRKRYVLSSIAAGLWSNQGTWIVSRRGGFQER